MTRVKNTCSVVKNNYLIICEPKKCDLRWRFKLHTEPTDLNSFGKAFHSLGAAATIVEEDSLEAPLSFKMTQWSCYCIGKSVCY